MLRTFLNLFILIAFASCITFPSTFYKPDEEKPNKSVVSKKMIIKIFDDHREKGNENRGGLGLVPFFPYGENSRNIPEDTQFGLSTPIKYYLADSLKQELNSRYRFSKLNIIDGPIDASDHFQIEGEINKYKCSEYIYFYGLSFFGVALWYLGLPISQYECEADLTIRLKNKDRTLLEETYNGKDSLLSGLYYIKIDRVNRIHRTIVKKIITEFLNNSDQHLSKTKHFNLD
ncbi:hypothetical protein [Leptospira kmetyi]|uniref:hypothetical protein n=1 Tax=Leptospira kmetyi TaxID=408139 RepID=UPI001FAEE25B|nr:hypothetical protein [Leptospira kmetyi]